MSYVYACLFIMCCYFRCSAVILLLVIHASIILCLYVNMSVFWCFLMYACILFISVVCLSCVFLYYYEIIIILKKDMFENW